MTKINAPHNLEAERIVIGSLVMEPMLIKDAVLSTEDFYSKENALFYEAMVEMFENDEPIELFTLSQRLGEDYVVKINECVSLVASTASFPYYEKIVKDLSTKRRIQHTLYETAVTIDEEADLSDIVHSLSSVAAQEAENVNGRKSGTYGEVSRWVSVSDGFFNIGECYAALKATTRKEKATIRGAFHRLVKDGALEKYGTKDGTYRRIQNDLDPINWKEASMDDLKIRYPFGIEKLCKTFPRNIAVIAGGQNSGKTFFLLEFTRLNMHTQPMQIHYFSSEMGASEFKVRLSLFENCKLESWKFHPWERSSNFPDVIRPDEINIIDYLEITDDFWKVAEVMLRIHERLKSGIAIIALQKDPSRRGLPKKEFGRGGSFGNEKPRLYLSMDQGIIKITKAKAWRTKQNPNGLFKTFKLIQGWDLMETSDWDFEEEEDRKGGKK